MCCSEILIKFKPTTKSYKKNSKMTSKKFFKTFSKEKCMKNEREKSGKGSPGREYVFGRKGIEKF